MHHDGKSTELAALLKGSFVSFSCLSDVQMDNYRAFPPSSILKVLKKPKSKS